LRLWFYYTFDQINTSLVSILVLGSFKVLQILWTQLWI